MKSLKLCLTILTVVAAVVAVGCGGESKESRARNRELALSEVCLHVTSFKVQMLPVIIGERLTPDITTLIRNNYFRYTLTPDNRLIVEASASIGKFSAGNFVQVRHVGPNYEFEVCSDNTAAAQELFQSENLCKDFVVVPCAPQ